jgi:hypothetical protein
MGESLQSRFPGAAIMNKLPITTLTFALAVLLSLSATAQNPVAKPALSPSQAVLAAWNDIGRKLIAMAEDFPEDKYDFQAGPGTAQFRRPVIARSGIE